MARRSAPLPRFLPADRVTLVGTDESVVGVVVEVSVPSPGRRPWADVRWRRGVLPERHWTGTLRLVLRPPSSEWAPDAVRVGPDDAGRAW